MPARSTSDGFRVGGGRDYLAALARKYEPKIKRLRSKLGRTRLPSDSARIQAEIDRLLVAWERDRESAERGLF